ncbi:coagulation factor XI-like [Synchiropus splendidus]|uniref:coagulation factor XI-like n=1 Tax=Synchiropus splendidus TaxID=270530 RepID=UPI00237E9E41|nr:coagulation factor XI-like [Synchiropus splendidus]
MSRTAIFASLLSLFGIATSQGCSHQLLKDVDFPGTDLKFVYAADENHCQLLCTQHPACLFFTFVRPDWTRDNRHFYCYLKSTPSKEPNVQTDLVGVTSGFSLRHCSTRPRPCLQDVYHNVDFPGADYRTLFTHDYKECQRTCNQDINCQFFTFLTERFTPDKYKYKCYLKMSMDVPTTPIVERKIGVVSGFSHALHMTPPSETVSECEGQQFPNMDMLGNSVESLPAGSAGHCQALCSAHPLCTHFTYASDSLTCSLRRNPDELVRRPKEGVTSGLPARFCQLDRCWLKQAQPNIDFRGSDIGFELMDDADICQKSCTSDPHCQFYTYVTQDFADRSYRGRCYFKRSITLPAPPKINKLPHVVSGFSLRDCVKPFQPDI